MYENFTNLCRLATHILQSIYTDMHRKALMYWLYRYVLLCVNTYRIVACFVLLVLFTSI